MSLSSDNEESDTGLYSSSDDEESDTGLYSSSSDDEETDTGLYFRTFAAVEKDNKHEFVPLFNRLPLGYKQTIMLAITSYDAANCLAAIFDGEAGDQSLINFYASDVHKGTPLHGAARCISFRTASLLLDKGFSPDLRVDFDSPYICLKNALPLNVSLDYVRFRTWSFEHRDTRFLSPIHQIASLCQTPSHRQIIRLFARKTSEIKHEFFKYLKQGKVFEVGALLAIASDLIMSSSPSKIDGENGSSIGFKNIMEMRQFVSAEMSRSLDGTQLKEIKKTLRLLEMFDRVGDKLLPHMPTWDDSTADSGNRVASLINDAAHDEKMEVEYDHDAIPSAYYTRLPYPIPSNDKTTLPYVIKSPGVYITGGQFPNSTRKFSTKVHFPSWLEKGNSHVYAPLPLPTNVKGAVTKHVLTKKHASFIRTFANAARHLRFR